MAEDDQNTNQEEVVPPAPEEQIPEQTVETQAQAEPEVQAAPEVEQPAQPAQEPEQPGFQIQMWQKVALLVVVVLAMGYFAFGQNLNFWPFKISVAPVISPTPTATIDPMADWKTYRNDEYGFEFRYPGKYKIESVGNEGLEKTKSLFLASDVDFPSGLTMHFDNLLAKDWENNSDIIKQKEVKIINNIQWTIIYYYDQNNPEQPYAKGAATTQNDAPYFLIDGTDESYNNKEFEQILSTFKFVPIIPADWKTYRNDEYGFEFRYPGDWEDQKRDIKIQNYFIKSGVGVLSIELMKENGDLEQIAQGELSKNNCPDDHVIKKDSKGILFVLYCSATSENYIYITKLQNNNVIKIWYYDDFQTNLPETEKLKTFDQILSTFKFVEAEGKFCGGIAAFPCPEGYTCQLEGTYPDAGGKCVKN